MDISDHDEPKRQLEAAVQALNPAERELWTAIQKFVDLQSQAGGSTERAYSIVRQLLRKARALNAQQRRAAFRIVE